MAAGSIVSRALGFVKNFLMGMVFGGTNTIAANAFSAANLLPNSVWILVGGGVLNAILVPAVVRAMTHRDGGTDYLSRLVTLIVILSLAVTAICTLAVPWLLTVGSGQLSSQGYVMAMSVGYWLMPQIIFSALYVLCGQILNAHNSFGPYSWAPVLNNVVGIIGALVFLVLFGTWTGGHGPWTLGMILTLTFINLGGSAAQVALLVVYVRGLGLRLRPRWGFRGMGLMKLGKIGIWSLLMIVLGQLAVFASRWSTENAGQMSAHLQAKHDPASNLFPAISALDSAYLAFMLPQGIIAVTLVTAIFPSLSRAAAAQDHTAVQRQYASVSRILLVPMMLCTVLFTVLAAPVMWVIVGGSTPAASRATGWVLIGYILGLVPFSASYLMKRAFYAYEDARSPFLMQIPTTAVSLVAVIPILEYVDPGWAAFAAALTTSIGSLLGWILGAFILSRHLRRRGARGSTLRETVEVYAKLIAAAIVSGIAGYAVLKLLDSFLWSSRITAIIVGVIVGVVVTVVFCGIALALRVRELGMAVDMIRRRGRGGPGAPDASSSYTGGSGAHGVSDADSVPSGAALLNDVDSLGRPIGTGLMRSPGAHRRRGGVRARTGRRQSGTRQAGRRLSTTKGSSRTNRRR
ncbi:murein biosynthesis integral membrane protein MurJ [Devriesea agamarum]|uniref:murein biosynthesis integral membrane protein MurJ n=1 Tax=Devriesea agamarum TaxID=472569 RepID=UPI000A00972F|nr:lipid II flippase MurJ [Devriesea agamarum]